MVNRRRVIGVAVVGAVASWMPRFVSAAPPATRPSADLEPDLERLRNHDPKEFASRAVMESAHRVFEKMDFVGLRSKQVRERLGAAHSAERIAGRLVWQYSYHDGEQGVVRNLWFDSEGRPLWGVEPLPTQ